MYTLFILHNDISEIYIFVFRNLNTLEPQLNVHWFKVFSRVTFSVNDCKPVISSWSSGNALDLYSRSSQLKSLKLRTGTISPYINVFKGTSIMLVQVCI